MHIQNDPEVAQRLLRHESVIKFGCEKVSG